MSSQHRLINPYVGPVPFSAEQKDYFFGREEEEELLLSLVISERLVLFYAQSGAGKSSLIQARLKPSLMERGYDVLPIVRVGGSLPKGIDADTIKNRYAFNLLCCLSEKKKKPRQLLGESLSSFLRDHSLQNKDHKPYWLIIDQFEEILTAYPERNESERVEFFREIKECLDADPLLSIVFAMREDQIAGLDSFSSLLPGRLNARFRMERLKLEDAILAITKPASLLKWSYAPNVAESLAHDLSLIRLAERAEPIVGEYVEPVHLQVVCKGLFDAVLKNGEQRDSKLITESDRLSFGDTDQALEKFYDEKIKEVVAQDPKISEASIRHWFGATLITQNRVRGQVNRGVFSSGDLPNKVVESLVNKYLVREEQTRGGRSYELSHDRLIDPVLSSNEKWFTKDNATPLTQPATTWQKNNRDKRFLLRGRRLQKTQEWYQRNKGLVSVLEGEFLANSVVEEVRRSVTFKSRIKIGAVLLTAVLGILIGYFWMSHQREVGRAYRRAIWEDRGRATRLSAYALNILNADPERSLLLAVHSAKLMIDVKAKTTDHDDEQIENQKVELKVREVLTRALENLQIKATLCNKDKQGNCAAASGFVAEHDAAFSISFGQDKNSLFVSNSDERISVWNTVSEQSRNIQIESDTTSPITAIASASFRIKDSLTTLLAAVTSNGKLLLVNVSDVDKLSECVAAKKVECTFRPEPNIANVRPIALAFSSDGKWLATGNQYGTISLLSVNFDNQSVPVAIPVEGFAKHKEGKVRAVAFSHDGKWLASAGDDNRIYVWDVNAKRQAKVLERAHSERIYALAFSPDESGTLASASEDMTVRIWRTSDWTSQVSLTRHTAGVHALAFSSDAKFLASGSEDRTIRIWNTKSWETSSILTGHHGGIRALTFSSAGTSLSSAPKNDILASSSEDKVTKLWQVDTRIPGANYLALSADGTRQASLSPQGDVIIRNIDSNQIVASFNIPDRKDLPRDPNAVPDEVFEPPFIKMIFNPVDYRLYMLRSSKQAIRWNNMGVPIWPFPEQEKMFNLASSPDGKVLLTVNDESEARVWDVNTGGPLLSTWTLDDGKEPKSGPNDRKGIQDGRKINAIAFYKSERNKGYLATGDEGGRILLWEVIYPAKENDPIRFKFYFRFDQIPGKAIEAVAFSADGKWFASAGEDRKIYIWDIGSKQLVRSPLTGHTDTIYKLAFSPNSPRLASRGGEGTINVWDTSSWKNVAQFDGSPGRTYDIAFSKTRPNTLVTTDAELPVLGKRLPGESGSDSTKDLLYLALKRLPRTLTETECNKLDTQELQKETCQQIQNLDKIIEGNRLAKSERPDLQKAIASYKGAGQYLSLSDAEIAKLIEEQSQEATLEYARNYLAAENFDRAIDFYKASKDWRDLFEAGQLFAQDEKTTQRAYMLYATAKEIYDQSAKSSSDDVEVASYYNNFCWFGSINLWRSRELPVRDVLPFCDAAIELDKNNFNLYDSRGVARALTEDPTLADGAIKDFQAYRDSTTDEREKRVRLEWINLLTKRQYAAAAKRMTSTDLQ